MINNITPKDADKLNEIYTWASRLIYILESIRPDIKEKTYTRVAKTAKRCLRMTYRLP